MITKAIIEEILDNGYHARVRIPIYHKAANSPSCTPFNQLPVASICCEPGSMPALKKGDIVFVAFQEDLVSQPVIVGMLFRKDDNSKTNLRVSSLQVDVNTMLSGETTIGDTSINDLKNIKNTKGNLQAQIDLLEQKLNILISGGTITPDPKPTSSYDYYININKTITEFVENTTTDWAKKYYIDLDIDEATKDMVADVVINTELTSVKDIGYLTLTDCLDKKVRVYFSNTPTSYTIKAIQLTLCEEK